MVEVCAAQRQLDQWDSIKVFWPWSSLRLKIFTSLSNSLPLKLLERLYLHRRKDRGQQGTLRAVFISEY